MTVINTGKWTDLSDIDANDAPTPLIKPLPQATEVPIADLGPLIEPLKAIETLTQAPFAIILNAVLGSISVVAQPHANVRTLAGSTSPISLFCLSIARSGERKTQVDSLATAPIREYEAPRMIRYQRDWQSYEEQLRSGHAPGDSGAVIEDPDQEDRPCRDVSEPPVSPQILFEDTTIEGKIKHFQNGRPSTGIFTDEGGIIFGGYSMNATNKDKTAALLSKLWDGKALKKNTAGGQPIFLPNRRVSAHIAVQPAIARKLLSDETLQDQGIFARYLLAFPDTKQGQRFIRMDMATIDARRKAEACLEAFGKRLTALLERKLPTVDGDALQLKPRTLEMEDAAFQDLRDFYNVTEEAQQDGERFADIRAHASKAPEQAARIAGVIALFEDPDATVVSRRQMSVAITLANFYLEEALRVLVTGTVPKNVEEAETLRLWLRDKWDEEFIDVSAACNRGPGSLRTADRIKRLFAVLEEFGWLQRVTGVHLVMGRRSRSAFRVIRG
ncbi:YfjI family protein [Tropicimonas aquimaris]|uniref:YfjI family protein n=1 Tax=Tropicimonas aquimaris TaxID=914152 RepID=A0ABW3IRE1_9RHOB